VVRPEPSSSFQWAMGGVMTTGAEVKVDVTARTAVMVTAQAPVPEQAPLQPEKVEPAAGVAVRVTAVPAAKLAPQVVPQVRAAGEEVTVPVPVPAGVTVST